jgi:hypothetical protein
MFFKLKSEGFEILSMKLINCTKLYSIDQTISYARLRIKLVVWSIEYILVHCNHFINIISNSCAQMEMLPLPVKDAKRTLTKFFIVLRCHGRSHPKTPHSVAFFDKQDIQKTYWKRGLHNKLQTEIMYLDIKNTQCVLFH